MVTIWLQGSLLLEVSLGDLGADGDVCAERGGRLPTKGVQPANMGVCGELQRRPQRAPGNHTGVCRPCWPEGGGTFLSTVCAPEAWATAVWREGRGAHTPLQAAGGTRAAPSDAPHGFPHRSSCTLRGISFSLIGFSGSVREEKGASGDGSHSLYR